MKEQVYNFSLRLDWKLLKILSQIDRFDASWAALERKEEQNLKQLKTIATIKSVGASTRIEGSKMTNAEVERLLNNIDISKIEDRDSQEVVGYFNVLFLINTTYAEIDITENNIKNLHNQLLKLSVKDDWHRGDYKQHTNAVEASFADGTRQIIFQTTEPGYATEDAMRALMKWYKEETEVHPLIRSAAFAYEFVSIHPFQDGNGRLTRLLTSLLLQKLGYVWIQYVSFEHEIEEHKKEYYQSLRTCQAQRPNEDITEWINFFLQALINIQKKLSRKLEVTGLEYSLSLREKSIYLFIKNNASCRSGEIVKGLEMRTSTVKKILSELVLKGIIDKHGNGRSTNYMVK